MIDNGPVTTLPMLSGSGVVLRPWRPDDAVDLHAAMQDPEIVRWLDVELPYTLEDALEFIDAASERWEERREAHFAVADPDDDEMIGYLGVLRVEGTADVSEIVYWVRPGRRGRGVATDAVLLALPWIEGVIRPRRLEASMVAGNLRSQSVVEACGFVLDGVRPGAARLDGNPADERVYRYHRPVHLSLGSLVVFVDDLASMLHFYRDLLGLAERRVDPGPGYRRDEDWALLDAGSISLEFRSRKVHGDAAARAGGGAMPAFEVDDLADTIVRLAESGVTTEAVTGEAWGAWTRLVDPEGNRVELYQPDPDWWNDR